jgi:hypothetical protein
MSFKTRQQGRSSQLRDGSPLVVPFSTNGVDYQLVTAQKVTLKLTAQVVTITAALDYGSVQLLTWPDRNLHILGMEVDLELTKGNTATGIVAATDLDVGIGSAAASAQTLATTMIDYLEKQDLDASDLTPALQVNVLGQSTATFPKQLADSATNKMYLNIGLPTPVTVDDTVTAAGTIDFYVIDMGNGIS